MRVAFLLLTLAAATACASPGPYPLPPPAAFGDTSGTEVPARSLTDGVPRETFLTGYRVSRSERDWEQPPSGVDFSRDMVILIAVGARSTGGYGLSLVRSVERGGELHLYVRETTPGDMCPVTQAFTFPQLRIAVPGSSATIRLHLEQVAGPPCGEDAP